MRRLSPFGHYDTSEAAPLATIERDGVIRYSAVWMVSGFNSSMDAVMRYNARRARLEAWCVIIRAMALWNICVFELSGRDLN